MTTTNFVAPTRLVPSDPWAQDRAKREELFGPEPVNPFNKLRTDIELSANRLAQLSHVDRKAIARLEAGTYTSPLPSMVDFWVNRGVVTEGELYADYENYQYQQRLRHEFYFGPTLEFNLDNKVHPLRQLRSTRPSLVDGTPLPVGITEFCESLCLPLDTIQYFEKKWKYQQSVPKQLKLVLNQVGYTRAQIAKFEEGYLKWREAVAPKVVMK